MFEGIGLAGWENAGTPETFGSFNFTDNTFGIDDNSFDFSSWNNPVDYAPLPAWDDGGFSGIYGNVTAAPPTPTDPLDWGWTNPQPISVDEPIAQWGQNVPPPNPGGFNVSGAINTATGALNSLTGFFRTFNQQSPSSQAPQRPGATVAPQQRSQFQQVVDAAASLTRDVLAVRANARDTANRLDALPTNVNRAIRTTRTMQDTALPRNRNAAPAGISTPMLVGLGVLGFAGLYLMSRGR